jgi:hypothetical protein
MRKDDNYGIFRRAGHEKDLRESQSESHRRDDREALEVSTPMED